MNKTELIDGIAARSGIKKVDITKAVDGLKEIIMEQLARGERITLTGFGSFSVRRRAAHTGRNPNNGESVWVEDVNTVKFMPLPKLKGRVNSPPPAPKRMVGPGRNSPKPAQNLERKRA